VAAVLLLASPFGAARTSASITFVMTCSSRESYLQQQRVYTAAAGFHQRNIARTAAASIGRWC
jgi:hypothetical protein